ncbi:MAG TPA: aldose 1-epimerase family protein [Azospirillaceae bacterium]|nr:aldose 1-epimerase family protein [Azospirillaceae bacterium]
MEQVAIRSESLRATVSPQGAELRSLTMADGAELLWDGDPAFWTGRSPLLFPVVGKLAGDTLRHQNKAYPMPQHGFARRSRFRLVEQWDAGCVFALSDSPETRAAYPFAFDLRAGYRLAGPSLEMAVRVYNPGTEDLPVSFGFHPAFRWPLVPGAAREEHSILFERDEPDPIRRAAGGLLRPDALPTPVAGDTLRLHDGLFADDAIVMDRHASRTLRYVGPSGPAIELRFPDMPHLGIWSKPGAGFVCLEPWQGHASPQGFDGEFRDKPGVVLVPPGGERGWTLTVTVA